MSTALDIPLLNRAPESGFAIRDGRQISVGNFLSDVEQLAGRLPGTGPALNLVSDRYGFLVAFCAVLTSGACNILPPNPRTAFQQSVAREHEGVYVIHDGAEVAQGLISVRGGNDVSGASIAEIPQVPANHIAAISYTSGSTGTSSPIPKTWNMLLKGAGVNQTWVLSGLVPPLGLVATVPAQHMYGLEMSVLLPLVADIMLHSGRPVYPVDVVAALAEMPSPRVLVTTPIHLAALVSSGLQFPPLDQVITATAPMPRDLAIQAERVFQTRLLDVFGCSEVGCMARREVARTQQWQPFDMFRFQEQPDGSTEVMADHMDEAVKLQDHLKFDDDGRFELTGRMGDMVNIGGKRGSLEEITTLLRRVPGVDDGQVFERPPDESNPRLVAVYAGSAEPADVRRYMRDHLDAVLVPRPLVKLPVLPRNDTGKLPREALLQALADFRSR